MFKDIQLSKDMMGKFKEVYDTEVFSLRLLDGCLIFEIRAVEKCWFAIERDCVHHWLLALTHPNIPCNLPKDVSDACDKYVAVACCMWCSLDD